MTYSRYIPVGGGGGGGGGSGTVTEVDTGTGLTGGPITTNGTVSLANTAVTPGTYGDATHVSRITVDQQGRLTAASSVAITGGTGTVTSVAQTVPAFLSISGSPITTSGTLAIGLSGTALPVANGGTGVTSLGNLTDAGTDGIVVTGGTGALITSASLAQHVADTTHNGYLSSTDWNTFNNKEPAVTKGNLTDAGTDGIVVTGGTGAVIGSGTSLAQHVADTTHNGYLSSTDWNTFNGKGSGTVTSVAMTVPAHLTISGSPITTSGTLAVGLSGTALPVANGGTGQTTYTNGQLLIGNTTGNTLAKATLTAGTGVAITNGTGTITIAGSTNAIISAIGITIDGGGSTITTGVKGYLYCPFACTITANTMLADVSGSIVVDIWKVAYASYPPTISNTITASALPTITSAQKSQDNTLTGWTTSVSAGDTFAFNVNSATSITKLNLVLTVNKT